MAKQKTYLGSVDIWVLIKELQWLRNARIQKVYQHASDFHLELFVPGKGSWTLVLGGGKFFATQHKFEYPQKPSGFVMALRKALGGKLIKEIRQHNFDRIVIVEADGSKLIAELLPQGNIILTEGEVIRAVFSSKIWKGRELKVKARYAPPPSRANVLELKVEQIKQIFDKEERPVVVWLADSIGGTYAEEICERAKIEKTTSCTLLEVDEIEKLVHAINEFFASVIVPEISEERGSAIDVTPFIMHIYRDKKRKMFRTFNEAVESYFLGRVEIAEEEARRAEEREEAERAARIKAALEAKMKEYYKTRDEFAVAGKVITENYVLMRDILEAAKIDVDAAMERFPQILGVDERRRSVWVKVTPAIEGAEPIKIELFLDLSLWDNVSYYYEKSKRMKEKIKGAEAALEVAKKKAEVEAASLKENVAKEVEKKAKVWYEKFRWFRSSEGFLVVAGRDAATNEILIGKYAEPNDTVVHAEIAGSPFAIIKTEGKTPGDATIKETAEFVASYSRAWRAGVGIVDVFWVKPEQLSKKTPSGESIGKGSFVVSGKKNTMRSELRLAIGFAEGKIVAGPRDAVAKSTQKFVTITTGETKSAELAKQIKTSLFQLASEEEKTALKGIKLQDIQQYIPFGKGNITK